MTYETYKRVVLVGRFGHTYTALCLICAVASLWRCVSEDAHMQLVNAEMVQPYLVSTSGRWTACPAAQLEELNRARAGAGPADCMHWDGLEAVESAGATAFVGTSIVSIQQSPCPEGGCPEDDGGIWRLESQSAGLVAAPENLVLKMAHSFRTRGSPQHAADSRQMAGRLVRFREPEDADTQQSHVHRHDTSKYEVLHDWPAHSGKATHIPLQLILRSAGVVLDAASDSPPLQACTAARVSSSNTGCLNTGDSYRARGVALELHVVYSNLWSTSDSLWAPSLWLCPAPEPSFQIHARRIPLREANRVAHATLHNGSRVVTTRFGVKMQVLGSGVLGSVTPRSVGSFVVETLIGLGLAWTVTELLLSLAALPRGTRLYRLAEWVCGGRSQTDEVCARLYCSGDAVASAVRRPHQD
jgi:hypothetical protein